MEKITGDSPEAKSLDITQQNIEQLKQLFPDVFSENKIDFEALKAVLGEEVDDSAERYNFTWNGKTKARQIAQIPSTGTLRPSKEESVNWDETENLFIEGDNLEVLKLLQKSYHKKIKLIYIDPPYNTGKDFVYKDSFQDNIKNYFERTGQLDSDGKKLSTNLDTSGRYHSNWLNMIYPRLKLARNLLQDNGVIAISIDENEIHNLRLVCDQIFGENNFITQAGWQKVYSPKNQARYLSNDYEFVLMYAKNIDNFNVGLLPRTEEMNKRYKNPDNDVRGPWKAGDLVAAGERSGGYYIVENPYTGEQYNVPSGKHWAFSQSNMEKMLEEDRVYFGAKKDSFPSFKQFLSEVKQGRVASSFFSFKDYGHTDGAKKELISLFGEEGKTIFETVKPTKLIQNIIRIANTVEGETILDFFAGSGTTAHAVMALNASEGTNLKCISVQIPEPTDESSEANRQGFKFVTNITRQRLVKAGEKIKKEFSESNTDYGFKSFKLDETNIRPWDADFDNLESVLRQATESIKSDRSNEDVLYEILLKYGIELTVPVETEVINGKQVFVVGAGALIVCLDDGITSEVVEGIAKLKDELDPETTQAVFKDAGFSDSNVKTNAIQILKQAGIDDVKSI
ncbi:site-specific DNA-methyltransferase [Psychrobacter sp.]|uniref:site-specific DNA-methyltransferase n=1 Tax=Psychrobacter sp. TaxID=56811 RepID=UPI0035647F60